MATLKAKRDRIIVKKAPPELTAVPHGQIVLPDVARKMPQLGLVLDVGPGYIDKDGKHRTPSVKLGDCIVFPAWSGANVKVKGEEFFILRAHEIIAVIEETDSETPFTRKHAQLLERSADLLSVKPMEETEGRLTTEDSLLSQE